MWLAVLNILEGGNREGRKFPTRGKFAEGKVCREIQLFRECKKKRKVPPTAVYEAFVSTEMPKFVEPVERPHIMGALLHFFIK